MGPCFDLLLHGRYIGRAQLCIISSDKGILIASVSESTLALSLAYLLSCSIDSYSGGTSRCLVRAEEVKARDSE